MSLSKAVVEADKVADEKCDAKIRSLRRMTIFLNCAVVLFGAAMAAFVGINASVCTGFMAAWLWLVSVLNLVFAMSGLYRLVKDAERDSLKLAEGQKVRGDIWFREYVELLEFLEKIDKNVSDQIQEAVSDMEFEAASRLRRIQSFPSQSQEKD